MSGEDLTARCNAHLLIKDARGYLNLMTSVEPDGGAFKAMLRKVKTDNPLFVAFSLIFIMMIMLGLGSLKITDILADSSIDILADTTRDIYRHPLAVSNAVLNAKIHIVAIHGNMKDVLMANTEQEIREATDQVDQHEKEIFRHFKIVQERFLGDMTQVTKTLQSIRDWRKIRNEVISLVRAGQYSNAEIITKGKGPIHVALIEKEMGELIAFAHNKALEYKVDSEVKYGQILLLMGILLFLVFLGNIAITIVVIRNIKKEIIERKKVEKESARFSRIFEDSLNEIYLFDKNTLKFVQLNTAAQHNLGYTMDELQEMTAVDVKPEFTPEAFEELIAPLLKGEKEKIVFETIHERKDKSLYDVEAHLQLLKFEHEELFAGIILDITERKQAEEELRKLSHAVESSSISVIITDLNGIIEYVNPNFTKITGYAKKDVIGENTRILGSGETPRAVYADLWETISSGREWKGKLYNRKKDGSLYWCRYSISGVKDADKKTTHYIATQEDVTHEHELSEQLSHQASHDALTGLVNRREFEDRAERLLSTTKQDNTEHALCFMDLDQFKIINDTCGHPAGDKMLHQIAMLLQHEVRKRDTLARLGGDEFGVLMEHCTLEQARRVVDSLQKAVQGFRFSWEEHVFKVGVSIGLVAITGDTPDLTELMKRADAACYIAKDLGRNRIHVYRQEDESLAQRHGEILWVERINMALEEDRFCLYAQPIVPLDHRTDKHYELLIRMKDEKGEIVLPGAFLPAAERYSLMVKLDFWVIEQAFSLLAAHPGFLEQIHFISINLSGQSLTDNSILSFIISQLDETGIDGNKICFEITETATISNLGAADKFIVTLRQFGCKFALDDFGSGLSSFGYLKTLLVDYLKIDGMFVKNIVDDPIDHAMVKSINDIGQVMGMQTIAEFVENDEIKGMLREIGVNYAQGYAIGKPMPFDELLDRSSNVTDIKKPKSSES